MAQIPSGQDRTGEVFEEFSQAMSILATWIREKDEPVFAPWFARRPGVQVRNARHGEGGPGVGDDALPVGTAGLLLTGGPDIGIECLRQPVPDPSVIEEPEPVRDRWEFAAVRAALAERLPIFAICKGVQVLNVALGGTLYLDIPGHAQPEQRDGDLIPLRYADDATGVRFAYVNSSHHQALNHLGDGLQVEAWSVQDDIIEQVRLRDYPFCLGVQYHPERGSQYAPLFDAFFDQVLAPAFSASV